MKKCASGNFCYATLSIYITTDSKVFLTATPNILVDNIHQQLLGAAAASFFWKIVVPEAWLKFWKITCKDSCCAPICNPCPVLKSLLP